jgi:hypothetical protein
MVNKTKDQMRQTIGNGGEDSCDAENLQVSEEHL